MQPHLWGHITQNEHITLMYLQQEKFEASNKS